MKMYLTATVAVIILGGIIWYLERGAPAQPEGTSASEQEQVSAENEQKQAQEAHRRLAATTPAPAPTPSTAAEQTLQATYVNTSEKDIFIVLPKPGQTVSPSITISGAVRGSWFFQDSFIAEVIAGNGDTLTRNLIPAKGNSMTTEMVQFSSNVFTNSPYRGPATVILRSNTPSGYPNPDRSVSIPIVIQ